MAEEKSIDKEAIAVRRLNVLAEMPAFKERLKDIKGGNQGFGKELKWGNLRGSDCFFSYYEDKNKSGNTRYIMTSDLIPIDRDVHPPEKLKGASKIPKDVDVGVEGLEGIEGNEDIDNWGGKRRVRKKTTKKTTTKRKTKK